MNPTSARPAPPPLQMAARWGGLVIALAAFAVYANSFTGPFVLDDLPTIVENASIHEVGRSLQAPRDSGLTVAGRPLLNLSLALNYAMSGPRVWSYHLVNLLIHACAGLALFGVLRRTFRRLFPDEATATSLGFITALLWTVHPLQTESVTYIVQRAESLMGLLYLLTLYCFIRGAGCHALRDIPPARRAPVWFVAALIACLLGMATKEVMVSAPLVLFLYDRTFVAGSFRDAWRQRGRWHLALAATWIPLAYLVLGTHGRGGSAGFDAGVSPWNYALTQCGAIVHYLRLAAWPHPLVMDYGTDVVSRLGDVLPQALLIPALIAAVIFALWQRPVIGFAGACFFALLAPSSSVVPVATQTVAEHRMYLPLAAVLGLVIPAIYSRLGRRGVALGVGVAVALGALTLRRNEDYRSAVSIWTDTALKRPMNSRAHFNAGNALLDAGRPPAEAIAHFDEVLRISPKDAEAYYNQGFALERMGRADEAGARYEEALRLKPDYPEAHNNLGCLLAQAGHGPEAIGHFQAALRANPGNAEYHANLGNTLFQAGQLPAAIAAYREALRLQPELFGVHFNLGNALLQAGQPAAARSEFAEALRLKPDYAEAQARLQQLDHAAASNR